MREFTATTRELRTASAATTPELRTGSPATAPAPPDTVAAIRAARRPTDGRVSRLTVARRARNADVADRDRKLRTALAPPDLPIQPASLRTAGEVAAVPSPTHESFVSAVKRSRGGAW